MHPLGQWVTQSEFSPVREVLMSFGWKRVVLASVATLTLGSVAQASELSLKRIADYSGERFESQDYSRSEHWAERRDPDRYYGRPVPEWRERRSHWGGYYYSATIWMESATIRLVVCCRGRTMIVAPRHRCKRFLDCRCGRQSG